MRTVTITVSSPDLRPSLVGVLEGLAGAGLIERIITTLAFSRNGTVSRLAGDRLSRLQALIGRRRIPSGLEPLVETIPLGEVVLQATGRLGLGDVFQHRVWMWAEPYFDRRVADRLGERATVLYGHEHASHASFSVQKRLGGVCLLRQVNAHYEFLDAVQDEEHRRFGVADASTWQSIVDSRPIINARKKGEYELADGIVVNSPFVRSTFLAAGIPAAKIEVAPTGCPVPLSAYQPRARRPMIVLYAGHLSLRKGTPYLLQAWRQLAPNPDEAELVLAGRNMLPEGLLEGLPRGVRWLGPISGPALDRWYRDAAVFVLPTLCEGLAHVIPEALSRGLPILTTANSGGEDLVTDGLNGWFVPIRDAAAIADRLEWCLSHPAELEAMGVTALETARRAARLDAVAAHVEIVRRFARLSSLARA